jgi:hypothetical protein
MTGKRGRSTRCSGTCSALLGWNRIAARGAPAAPAAGGPCDTIGIINPELIAASHSRRVSMRIPGSRPTLHRIGPMSAAASLRAALTIVMLSLACF